jgi:CBS domain-containing protein
MEVPAMLITEVMRRKGNVPVVTVAPDRPVTELLEMLSAHRVGALVVSSDGTTVEGIVSERDVVRHLHSDGAHILELPVQAIMTAEVYTCGPGDDLQLLMRRMTDGRFRHVPVVDAERLVGIVSIGDVVKNRIDDLESERDQLTAYITG